MTPGPAEVWPVLPFAVAVAAYGAAVLAVQRRRPWPWSRLVLWVVGAAVCGAAVAGPLAELADVSFVAHMVTHLMLGMLGPLLLVLAAPITLALRALPTSAARGVVRFLSREPVRFLADPLTAAVMDLVGLWVLYCTRLFSWSQESAGVHLLVHAHVLVWGYLLTTSVVAQDPVRHRRGYAYRGAVLVGFLAGHAVLAKYLYAHPPLGVPGAAAETGAMVMYYGGDVIDVAVLLACGARWYAGSRPRPELERSAV